MTSVRHLKIIIDQAGNGAAGIQNIAGGLGHLASIAGVAAAAAGVAIVGIGAKLVSMGSDAEEMLGKFNVVFGEFAESVTGELTTFARAAGRSKYTLQEMASSLQDTFVPMGFAREEAAKMSVEMTKLAVDVGSFNNVTDEEVIRDFQSALVGNTETVRKYGIVINQARIEAKALEMGLVGTTASSEKVTSATNALAIAEQKLTELMSKENVSASRLMSAKERVRKSEEALAGALAGTTGELTEQAKVLAIQQLILEGTTDAQGDAERTSGSWANQMRRLKGIIGDTATTLGLKLLPVVTPYLKKLGDLAENVMPVVIDKFTIFAENILPRVARWLSNTAQVVLPMLIGKFRAVVDFLKANVVPIIQSVGSVFGTLAGFITGTVAPAIANIASTVLPPVNSALAWLAENVLPVVQEQFSAVVGIISDAVPDVIARIEEFASMVWDRLGAAFTWISETAVPAAVEAFGTFKVWISEKLVPAVREFNENTIKPFIQSVKDWIAEFKERLGPVMDEIHVMIDERLKPALVKFKESWDRIVEVFGAAKDKGDATGESFDTIGAILWVFKAAVDVVVWVVEAASNAFSVLAGALERVGGVLDWLKDKWNKMKEAAQAAINAIPPWLRPGSPTPFELGLRGIGDAMDEVNEGFRGFGPSPAAGAAAGSAGGVVNLTYSPAISLADKREVQEKLIPLIKSALGRQDVRGILG